MADSVAPKTPEVKYDYPGHVADDNAIKVVETALAAKFPESYKEGLASTANDAPIKEAEAHGKIQKAQQDAKQEEISNPDAVKKVPVHGVDYAAAIRDGVLRPRSAA